MNRGCRPSPGLAFGREPRVVSQALPTTGMIDVARGVILRGAGWAELWPHAAVLAAMAVISLTVSAVLFRKRLG